MSELPIDGSVADYMCDVVEAAARLNELLTGMRWRMRRGEPKEMALSIWRTKRQLRDLKVGLEMVEHCLEVQLKRDEEKSTLTVVK